MREENLKSDFIQTIFSRGFINDCSDLDGLDKKLTSNKQLTAYVGYDATA